MAKLLRRLRQALPLAVAAVACAAMARYLLLYQEQWRGISIERPALLAVCGAACLVALLVPGPIFKLMTSRVGVAVGLRESIGLAVMTSAINAFVPLQGGVAARAVYLKKWHGLELSRFAATFLGYNILRLCAASSLACAAGLWLMWQPASGDGSAAAAASRETAGLQWLVAISAAMAAAAFGTCFIRPAWFRTFCGRGVTEWPVGQRSLERIAWLRPIFMLHAGWLELIRCPAFLLKVFALVVLQIMAEVVMVWAAWNAVGAMLSPVASLLVASFGILTGLTGLTPGGIGLVDLVSVAVGATVAIDPARGIAANVAARGVGLAVLGVIAPLAFARLVRRQKEPGNLSKLTGHGDISVP
jgi:uncharacterized membrane protein YbhN (UPF0104 family)